MKFNKKIPLVSIELQKVQYQGFGSFWVPPNAYADLGFLLPARVRPSDSKAYQSEYHPKNKDDLRGRTLHTGELHKWSGK
jgi:hypothetical protein